jgi:hypothetical protein
LSHDLEGWEDIHKRWKLVLISRWPRNEQGTGYGAMIGSALHPHYLSDWQFEGGIPDDHWVSTG